MGMTNNDILVLKQNLIKYCYSEQAKRSEIVKKLKELEDVLNAILPFD